MVADELIGSNVLSLRGSRTQKELAERMREKGHKWTQTTVWSVEQGERPLRLSEAVSLSEILGVSLSSLVADSGQTAISAQLRLRLHEWEAQQELAQEAQREVDRRTSAIMAILKELEVEHGRTGAKHLVTGELRERLNGFVGASLSGPLPAWLSDSPQDEGRE